MAQSKVSLCLKYLIFFLNFFFWLTACLMIAIGTWAYLHKNQFQLSFDNVQDKSPFDFIFDAAVVMVAVGLVVFILAFTGCVGALRENTCLIKFYYISLIIVFLLEVAAVIVAFVFSSSVRPVLESVIKEEALSRYFDDPDLMNMIDFFQKEFSCCGVGPRGYKNWNINPYYQCVDNNTAATRCAVPFSCCIDPVNPETELIDTMCGHGVLAEDVFVAGERIWVTGCVSAALSVATTNLYILAAIAIVVAISQIATIFMARTLEDQIADQKMQVQFSGYG